MNETLSQETINTFVVAAHHDLPEVQHMLATHPDLLNASAEWMETAVQAAAHTGQREIVQFLLDQGAPLDICTAAMMGMRDALQQFITDSPEMLDDTGAHDIPLMFYPALMGNIEIADILFSAGVPVNEGEGGNTALHGAAGSGHAGMVLWLLDHDANPYALDFNGRMPIDLAEAGGFEETAALLRPYMKTG